MPDQTNNNITPVQSAAINAGSGVVSSFISNQGARNMMERQHEYNLQDWSIQNEYNLPKNQYDRYVAAGMSPAAAMQAVAGIKDSSSMQGVSLPSPSQVSMDPAGAMMQQQHIMLDKRLADLKERENQAYVDYLESMTNRNNTLTSAEYDNIVADTKVKETVASLNVQYRKTAEYSLQRMQRFEKVDYEKIVEEIKTLREQQSLLRAQTHTEGYKQAELYSSSVLNQAQTENVIEETKSKEHQNVMLAAQALYTRMTGAVPGDNIRDQFGEAVASGDKDANKLLDMWFDVAESAVGQFNRDHGKVSAFGAGLILGRWQDRTLRHWKDFSSIASDLMPFKPGSIQSVRGFSR